MTTKPQHTLLGLLGTIKAGGLFFCAAHRLVHDLGHLVGHGDADALHALHRHGHGPVHNLLARNGDRDPLRDADLVRDGHLPADHLDQREPHTVYGFSGI